MSDKEPDRNESIDEAVWLDLVARLEQTPDLDRDAGHGAEPGKDPQPKPDGQPGHPSPQAGLADGDAGSAGGGAAGAGADAQNPAPGTPRPAEGSGTAAGGRQVPPSPAERTRALFGNRLHNQSSGPRPAPWPGAAGGTGSGAAGGDGPRPSGPRDYVAPEEDDDAGFEPPEPPPLGSGEPLLVLAWLGAAGGPLLLLLFAMFWRDAPLALVLGIIALFAASAGYLLYRLPTHRQDGDDGSVV